MKSYVHEALEVVNVTIEIHVALRHCMCSLRSIYVDHTMRGPRTAHVVRQEDAHPEVGVPNSKANRVASRLGHAKVVFFRAFHDDELASLQTPGESR